MTRHRLRLWAVAVLLMAALPRAVVAEDSVVDLTVRSGVTLRYLALAPAGPVKAAALLFTGGQGVARIPDRPGPEWARNGAFVVRSREHFRALGLFVAVVDAPSDHQGERGLGAFRVAPEHAQDIAAVIADVRRRSGEAKVWLIGTSRGTISAANAAARLTPPEAADGLVLTSTATRPSGGQRPRAGIQETVYDLDLAQVRLPTLLVYHQGDQCWVTPPEDVALLRQRLTGAPRVGVIAIDGGSPPQADVCEALSAHGFFGREAETVGAIVAWIFEPRP